MSKSVFREARFVAGEGRTISGTLAYGSDLVSGCFARSIQQRASKLALFGGELRGRANIVGRAVELREEPGGLRAVFTVDDGPAGDVVLERARRGGVDVIVGYRPIGACRDGVVSEAALEDFRVAPARAVAGEPSGPRLSRSTAQRRLRLLELQGKLLR
ncbi:hypothetical protein NWT09_13150 [Mycolicibacterium sp. jd]|uniref:hypothetical protein n=1 Tax=unclassified Mycolicibacterium TaxID=2636767 RepID=UPI00351B7804